MICIRNLSLSRGSENVFSDISLEIDDNEILGITGGPGCGKSSLLVVLRGREKHFSGEVLMGNDNIRNISASGLRRQIAFYSPQEKEINQESTVYDTVIRGRRAGKNIFSPYTDDDRESTEKYIEQYELAAYSQTRLKQLHASAGKRHCWLAQ